MKGKFYTIIMICCFALTCWASEGVERYPFTSELNEKRFTAFIHGTRCMICESQSVAESNSMFSQDMKDWLYEAIESGQTDHEIKMALIARFGDSVFYSPPMQANTVLLWGLPLVFVLLGLFTIARIVGSNRRSQLKDGSRSSCLLPSHSCRWFLLPCVFPGKGSAFGLMCLL